MCDTVSTSILLGTLSLLLDNRYISLARSLAGLILYIINRHRPSNKVGRVEGTIKSVAGTLKRAKEDCPLEPRRVDGCHEPLVRRRKLEPRSVKTWKEFAAHLQNSREIVRNISQCGKNVKEIQVPALGERQRQLSVGIEECRELLEKVLHPGDTVATNQLLAMHLTTPYTPGIALRPSSSTQSYPAAVAPRSADVDAHVCVAPGGHFVYVCIGGGRAGVRCDKRNRRASHNPQMHRLASAYVSRNDGEGIVKEWKEGTHPALPMMAQHPRHPPSPDRVEPRIQHAALGAPAH
ncbi:hypothetical protein K438DRAFT_1774823 [Mycena galopus ATCC 62051]|nr:hypothetical protein K438DRAFT_1774823 [Mycena galopus ATCC 62051]